MARLRCLRTVLQDLLNRGFGWFEEIQNPLNHDSLPKYEKDHQLIWLTNSFTSLRL